MAEIIWEKTAESASAAQKRLGIQKRYGYLVLGLVLLGFVAFLVVDGLATGRYYMTVDELVSNPNNVDKNVRVAGAVIGDTIHFDPQTQILTFTVVNIPNDNDAIRDAGGLGAVLHNAIENPDATRLQITWKNAEMPDLLQNEAQAIMTGKLDENGIFHADQVLLKCPTRYSDEVPSQAAVETSGK